MIRCNTQFTGNDVYIGGYKIEPVDVEWDDIGIRWKASYCNDEQFFTSLEDCVRYVMGRVNV